MEDGASRGIVVGGLLGHVLEQPLARLGAGTHPRVLDAAGVGEPDQPLLIQQVPEHASEPGHPQPIHDLALGTVHVAPFNPLISKKFGLWPRRKRRV